MRVGLERAPNESVDEYQIRLCEHKDEYGLTWPHIAELMNVELDEDYGESRYRKWWSAFSKGVEYERERSISDDVVMNEYRDQLVSLQKERYKLADERREYNKLVREQARLEHIHDELVSAVHKMAEHKPLEWSSSAKQFYGTRESALILTDWHRGMFASNYWNEYNNDEFDRRVKRVMDKSIEYNQMNGVRKVHVFLNGDLCNGILHVTSRIMSTENVIQQVVNVAETLSEYLTRYANLFDEIEVHTVPGNHSRVIAKKEDALSKENFEMIIPWYLQARLSGVHNLTFATNTYDETISDTVIAGWDVAAVHGDLDSPGNTVQNLSLMIGKKPDYIYMGHRHKYFRDEVHGTHLIMSPALCGVDDYSKSKRLTSTPAQLLTIYDEYEGELCTYPIRVDIK